MSNIVILAGRIGAAPTFRQAEGAVAIARFRLATSRPRFRHGKPVKEESGRTVVDTTWHHVAAFGTHAEHIAQHCVVGMKVLVRGRLQSTQWRDDKGERHSCEIIVEEIDFLSPAAANAAPTEPEA